MAYHIIRPRSGTASEWEEANPILGVREIGFEVPENGVGTGVVKMKMGDGSTPWTNLPYAIEKGLTSEVIETDFESESDEAIPSVGAICQLINTSILSTQKITDANLTNWLSVYDTYNLCATINATSTTVVNVPYGGSGVVWTILVMGTSTRRKVVAFRDGSDEIYLRDWGGSSGWVNDWTKLPTNQDVVKTVFMLHTTGSLAGNSDHEITVGMPDEYEVIEAIVPVTFAVTADWSTRVIFTSIDVSKSKINVHTVGSTAQQYIIGYYVHYK